MKLWVSSSKHEEAILKLRAEDMPLSKIAKTLGLSDATVLKVLRNDPNYKVKWAKSIEADTIELIKKLRLEDRTVPEIAAEIEISHTTVLKYLKLLDPSYTRKVTKLKTSPEIESEVLRLAGTMPQRLIAEKLGIQTITVQRILKRNGPPPDIEDTAQVLLERFRKMILKMPNGPNLYTEIKRLMLED